jgi:hypothetical protein
MAQAGFTPISLYYSTTASAVPSSGNLVAGELALNTVDEKLYFKNSAGTVKLLASNATSAPVVSFSAGTTGFTPNTATTGAVTLAGTLATTNGGTGLTSFTSGGVVYASSSSALATGSALTFNGTTLSVTGPLNLAGTSTFPTSGLMLRSADNQLKVVAGSAGIAFAAASGASTFGMFDSSGNLGLGVTPSAWDTIKPLQSGNGSFYGFSTTEMGVNQNMYYASGAYRYITSAVATAYRQISGVHSWHNAASGTAGNAITFTQAMTLDASGNLGVGTTTPAAKFQTQQTSAGSRVTGALLQNVGSSASTAVSLDFAPHENTSSPTTLARIDAIRTQTSNGLTDLAFSTFNATLQERARIDSSGRFIIQNGPASTSTSTVKGVQIYFDATNNQGYIYSTESGVANYPLNINASTMALGSTVTTFVISGTERARMQAGFSVGTTADPGAGAIYATGNITAFFSDKRLKTVSGKIENALDKVGKLSGVYYTFNDTAKSFGYDSDEEQVGVIAQEVEAVLPQIVKAAPFDLDENNNSKSGENYKTVQYDKLVPLLIEAINELRAEVKALKGE